MGHRHTKHRFDQTKVQSTRENYLHCSVGVKHIYLSEVSVCMGFGDIFPIEFA